MVADELRRQADQFIELQDLAAEISRAHQARNNDRDETDDLDHDFYDDYDDEPIVETI